MVGVFGGPPCQAFSDIGHRKADDPRRDMVRHFFRLVAELRPVFFVMDAMLGVVTHDEQLRPGDLVRITVNAHPHAILDEKKPDSPPLLVEEKRAKQFQKLKDRIGDFLPSGTGPQHMTEEDLPLVLSRSFAAAVLEAMPVTGDSAYVPLSIVRYSDGQQMLSITGAVVQAGDEEPLRDRLRMADWPFASADWAAIHPLVVPHLTLRERLFLERGVTSKSEDELMNELGFCRAADIQIADFLKSYKNYYRFYPTLLSTDP